MKNILTIAKFTFKDVIQSRVLYITAWISLLILVLNYVTSEFSYGNVLRVSIDFGLGGAAFASNILAVFIGVNVLSQEIESRTIYIALSRPISRIQFLLGKILGVTSVLSLSTLIIFGISTIVYLSRGGTISSIILNALVLGVIESVLLFLIVLFFSLITSRALSVINTIVIYFIGHAVTHISELTFVKNREGLLYIINAYKTFLPDLNLLNLKPFVFNSDLISTEQVIYSYSYGFSYILILSFINAIIFKNKELT
ncbi:ABC transporter permease [Halobacteriovorax vibrionivorans]|uniref:ABC transporter permease n=1 Tax=Halobacteriovorax vibrionivorans TaxID=2152716 RepID=A0ABY0IKM1_9BACT|nr:MULTISPECIES: ABC transporter permease [Halobacteriovorax]RZF23187.1 ABC transporter permease [Halobacteriovorax vibrionivorans]TGD46340.1 ABC transporter permease [Halobacteriovorax sp. Y22]